MLSSQQTAIGESPASATEAVCSIPVPPAVDLSRRNLGRLVAKNASANLVRLAGAGIVALLLPPFLVREMSKGAYGAWALLLQLTLYVSYFDFGIQTAVARFVAHADELSDTEQRDEIVSTALVMLSGGAALGGILILVMTWRLPSIFHQMPAGFYQSAQVALLVMGGSFALGLPATLVSAYFTGMQRNEVPAAIAIGNKVAMALLVVGVVLRHKGLAAMGAAVAVANIASYAGAFAVWRKYASEVKIRLALVSKSCLRLIGGYSATLMVWMAAMLMISGLDLVIVGIFDYKATAYYAIAATLTTFLAQVQGSIFAALLPASAVLAARGDGERLGRLLVSSTRYGMLILLAMAAPLVLGGHYILQLWAGADYAAHATLILQILVIANVIRLCALPYSTLLLGTGQQNKVIISPLAEGVTNLATSIAGAYLFGAVGVAIGTLIGAFVSVGLHLFYNMPRTALIRFSRVRLVKDGVLRPLMCCAPLIVLLPTRHAYLSLNISVSVLAAGMTVFAFWKYGLENRDREQLMDAIRLL
ncbi:MAG TPA: polysaccharide biosynthesis C-terminal domain-containing protein [Terriglobales bacterium]|jgi:O-antigen/teichoic acid export membrane protein